MKKSLLLIASAVALIAGCGCSSTTITKTDPVSGHTMKATNRRWFWSSEGVDISFASQSNGSNSVVQATAKISKSNASADAINAAAAGAAQGVAAGLTGAARAAAH